MAKVLEVAKAYLVWRGTACARTKVGIGRGASGGGSASACVRTQRPRPRTGRGLLQGSAATALARAWLGWWEYACIQCSDLRSAYTAVALCVGVPARARVSVAAGKERGVRPIDTFSNSASHSPSNLTISATVPSALPLPPLVPSLVPRSVAASLPSAPMRMLRAMSCPWLATAASSRRMMPALSVMRSNLRLRSDCISSSTAAR
jgi:hypothetical protein